MAANFSKWRQFFFPKWRSSTFIFSFPSKDGVVFESGNHAQLMAKEGLYFELATAQTTMDIVDDLAGEDAIASYDST